MYIGGKFEFAVQLLSIYISAGLRLLAFEGIWNQIPKKEAFRLRKLHFVAPIAGCGE